MSTKKAVAPRVLPHGPFPGSKLFTTLNSNWVKSYKKDYKTGVKNNRVYSRSGRYRTEKMLGACTAVGSKITSASVRQRLSPEQGHHLLLIAHESMCCIMWMLSCPYQKLTRHPCPRITDSSPLSDRLQDVPISFVFLKKHEGCPD